MKDVLLDARKELLEKGLIDQDLLVWAMKQEQIYTIGKLVKKLNPANHKMVFFGLKGEKLMILPLIDFKNVLSDEVQYYAREDLTLGFSAFQPAVLKISFQGGGSAKYQILQGGLSDMKKMISMFNDSSKK
jgi:hypothetical protein